MSDAEDFMATHRQLLVSGFPADIVRKQVQRHKEGLLALPDETPDKHVALQQADAFLKELERL